MQIGIEFAPTNKVSQDAANYESVVYFTDVGSLRIEAGIVSAKEVTPNYVTSSLKEAHELSSFYRIRGVDLGNHYSTVLLDDGAGRIAVDFTFSKKVSLLPSVGSYIGVTGLAEGHPHPEVDVTGEKLTSKGVEAIHEEWDLHGYEPTMPISKRYILPTLEGRFNPSTNAATMGRTAKWMWSCLASSRATT
jgi:hypothetical protein